MSRPLFGLSQKSPFLYGVNDDYETKYTEDATYEETAPHARIWRTYLDEAAAYDTRMIEEFRDTLDVLLVFAGLFSAVVTTFLVEAASNLQANFTEISATLLFELVALQRAIVNGTSIGDIPTSSFSPNSVFVPSTSDVWVNGLWFTSLVLSLMTALVSVLVKQWLHHYMTLPSGTPRERAHLRQYRSDGLEKWRVPLIVGLLPVLLHLALYVYLVGLSIYLYNLHRSISWIVVAMTLVAFVVYFTTNAIPIIRPQCPYHTPISHIVYPSFIPIYRSVMRFLRRHLPIFSSLPSLLDSIAFDSLKGAESLLVQDSGDIMTVNGLFWLFQTSNNPTVLSIVFQSIGGLPVANSEYVMSKFSHDVHILVAGQANAFSECLDISENSSAEYTRSCRVRHGSEMKLERLLRSHLYLFPTARSYQWRSSRYALKYLIPRTDIALVATIVASREAVICSGENVGPKDFLLQSIHSGRKFPAIVWLKLLDAVSNEGHVHGDSQSHISQFLGFCNVTIPFFIPSEADPRSSTFRYRGALLSFPAIKFKALRFIVTTIRRLTSDDSEPHGEPGHRSWALDAAVTALNPTAEVDCYMLVSKWVASQLASSQTMPDHDIYPKLELAMNTLRFFTYSVFRIDNRHEEVLAIIESMILESQILRQGISVGDSDGTETPKIVQECCQALISTYRVYVGDPAVRPVTLNNTLSVHTLPLRLPVLKRLMECFPTESSHTIIVSSFLMVLGLVIEGFRRNDMAVFDAFVECDFLNSLVRYGFHMDSMIEAITTVHWYVHGLRYLVEKEGRQVLGSHFRYLGPERLFVATHILSLHFPFTPAKHSLLEHSRATLRILLQLCPERALWEICRERLVGLLQSDDPLDFLTVAHDHLNRTQLEVAAAIEEEKRDVDYALELLDSFV